MALTVLALTDQRGRFRYRRVSPRPARWARKRRSPAAPLLLMLGAGLLAPLPSRAEKPQDLRPQGYVNDFAGVLSPDARSKLTALCSELDQKAHAQIALVTVHSLEGDSIEDFSITLAQKWGVGPKTDRGVLILLAVNDHKYRVEVGYGLEAILPDGKVGGFGRQMLPALRQGDYDGALLQLTGSIAGVIAQSSGVALTQVVPIPRHPEDRHREVPAFIPILIALFLFGWFGVFALAARGGRRWWRGGPWIGGGPWISGGFGGRGFGGFGGGGGGGGGGFGGFGGGSFGGGGASGSW
jgi:uncharacterized protein